MDKMEIVITKDPKTKKWSEPKLVKVTPKRTKNYMRSIIPRYGKEVGKDQKGNPIYKLVNYSLREYCENCGRIFGKGAQIKAAATNKIIP